MISAALTDRGRRYPTLAAVLGTAAEAMISVPARVPGPSWCAVVGALGVGFPRPRPVAPAEVAALAALADRGAGVLAAAGLLPCQSAELRPIGADEFRAAVPRPGGPTVAAGAAGSDNRAGRAVPTGLSAPQEAGAGLGLGGVDLGLLETLLIHAPVGVAVLDRELRFVLVNPRAG